MVLGLDGTGLESSLVETANKTVGPALLNEAPRSSGGDGAATGVGTKHRGVAPTKEERMEFRKEGAGGGEVELHAGFLTLTIAMTGHWSLVLLRREGWCC